MQHPRLIASSFVVGNAKALIAEDPQAAVEFRALLTRTRTIFAMDYLSFGGASFAAVLAGAPQFRIPAPSPDNGGLEATPLNFLPSTNAFEPTPIPIKIVSIEPGGLHPEGLGFEPKGYKPIDVAKAALSRMQALGAAWLLTGDDSYARRGASEMRALCALPHWGGDQYLAVATIMQSLAIGYDWLRAALSEADRALVLQTLIDKGVAPMLAAFDARPQPNWITVPSNWNIVCNASLIMTALAIMPDTDHPGVGRVRLAAQDSLASGMSLFDADGSWKLEGPGYWHLATEHLTYLLAALETTGETAGNIFAAPGISETGRYRCYMTGPSTALFNFGDCEEQRPGLWWLRWLGTRFDKAELHELAEDRTGNTGAAVDVHPMDVLWRRRTPTAGAPSALATLPLSARFAEVTVLRGPWGNDASAYVAIKGGETSGLRTHTQLDLGSFVYEIGGRRWAIDLEPDDYTTCYLEPPQRYAYYRAGTFGHNTLVINDRNQPFATRGSGTAAVAARFSPITESRAARSVTVDLSAAYPMARSVRRTFTLDDAGRLTIVDEIEPASVPLDVVWSMHTRATVVCDGAQAVLAQPHEPAGEPIHLYASLRGVAGARFDCVDAGAPTPLRACDAVEASNIGIKRLLTRLPTITSAARLEVTLSPLPPAQ